MDRTRPFIVRPIIHCAPTNRAKEYIRSCFKRFRNNNPEFDEFLKELKEEIVTKKQNQYKNILRMLNDDLETNWYTPKKSLFSMLIKLYNYDFSASQALEYIDKCYEKYQYLLNDNLKLDDEYEVFVKRSRWDGSSRDFINISLSPKKDPADWDEHYYIDISMCSLETDDDVDYMCDTEVNIRSRVEIYEDALMLFAYYQGNEYFNKLYRFAVDELIKNKILRRPLKVDYGHTVATQYVVCRPQGYKI